MSFSMVYPGGFWFEAQVKMLLRIKAWMRSLSWHRASEKSQDTTLIFNLLFFCLNRTKITHSTGNDIFYGQSRWILIWSTNKNLIKDNSLNIPATLDIAPQKNLTKHKSHLQSSVFCLNRTKITHSTGNDFFYGQSKSSLIWSTSKNVVKNKILNAGLNVPATLDIAPQKNHKTQISSSIVCFLLESNKNYTFNWKLCFLWSTQVDFDLKYK